VGGQIRPLSHGPGRPGGAAFGQKMADFRGFSRLARLLLSEGQQGCFQTGVTKMSVSKFETFAFMAGFIATGFLTLVALPLAA
jgi:hypothetical protein